jgi:hypothetical protein
MRGGEHPATHGRLAHTALRIGVCAVSCIALGGVAHLAEAPADPQVALPDGRAWELVSSPQKRGAEVQPIREGAIQASQSGGAITYFAPGGAAGEGPVGNPGGSQELSTRAQGGGWSSQDIATEQERESGATAGRGSEYRFFSPDLSRALVEPLGETRLSEAASEKTVYRREANGLYTPLVTAANVPAGTRFAGTVGFEGATADLSHSVLKSEAPLTPGATEGGLYEWAGGQLQLLSVLPGGAQAPGFPFMDLGDGGLAVRNAISDDGSRVVWEWTGEGPPHLYLRDMARAETAQLDVPEEGAGGGVGVVNGRLRFQTASADGSEVFFSDGARLTADSNATETEPDLYEFEVTSHGGEKLAGSLIDLTKPEHGESANFQGALIGADEAGTMLYFVADAVLSTAENAEHAKAEAGAPNLYALRYDEGTREWKTTFVAALSSADDPDWAGEEPQDLGDLTARVSPNGRYLAFMSEQSLTGYDNRDESAGSPDEEVYLYDADSGKLVCASCSPSGGRPVGVYDAGGANKGLLIDRAGVWAGHWLAAIVPGWTPIKANGALYQSRYLSNNGRLFFDSADALVAHDANGVADVYEFEPDGVGDCRDTGETFVALADGCVGLISSGQSAEESAFIDASESGGDVFFVTAAALAPPDADSAFDVYDAHECTSTSPCAASAQGTLPCADTDACRGVAPAQPGYETAPTSLLSGAGNLSGPIAKPPPTARPLTRAQKLGKALRACRKLRQRRTRAACEAHAKARYAPHRPKPKQTPARKAGTSRGA